MSDYEYQGTDKQGKKVTGSLQGSTEGEIRVTLRGMGIRPSKISRKGALNADLSSLFGGNTVPLTMIVGFTRQLQVLISSGVPLVQALELLVDQASDRTLKTALATIKEKVSSGSYFWEAISAYPKIFPKVYVSLVKAGEASGAIDQILRRLTTYLESNDKIRKMVKSALGYPILVTGIGAVVVGLMLAFVIPKFESMLKGNHQELPGPTKLVITLSHFMVNNGGTIVISLAVGGYLLMRYLKSPEGKAIRDRVTFRLPMFGEMIQKGGIARFSRTMQTLLMSGVNLIDAINICNDVIDNVVLEEAIKKIRSEVESGKTFGSVIAATHVFPRMAVQMISIGESTGNIDKMFEKVADYYETEVESAVAGLSKMIEPLIMVFLGGTVGGMMIAMYMPIFKMAGG